LRSNLPRSNEQGLESGTLESQRTSQKVCSFSIKYKIQKFCSWDRFRHSLQQYYSWRLNIFKYFRKARWKVERTSEGNKSHGHQTHNSFRAAGYKGQSTREVLKLNFSFLCVILQRCLWGGWIISAYQWFFLSRHLDMAIKLFLLESCPHHPQEKN